MGQINVLFSVGGGSTQFVYFIIMHQIIGETLSHFLLEIILLVGAWIVFTAKILALFCHIQPKTCQKIDHLLPNWLNKLLVGKILILSFILNCLCSAGCVKDVSLGVFLILFQFLFSEKCFPF